MLDMVGKDVLELVSTVNGLSKVRDVRCCFCRGLEECLHGSCCQSSRFGSGRFNGVARAFDGHGTELQTKMARYTARTLPYLTTLERRLPSPPS